MNPANDNAGFASWLDEIAPALDAWGRFVVSKMTELVSLELDPEQFKTFFKVKPGYRVKERESALKKQEKKQYLDPRESMTDLVGARFVVLLQTDLQVLERVLVAYPGWVRSKDRDPEREREAQPNIFDYQSVHYLVRNIEEREIDGVKVPAGLSCEVQLRTLLQHAYAELVHDKFYKGEGFIPPEASRLVARSMALMETTDEMFVAAVSELERVNQSREQWGKALDDAVGVFIPGFKPTVEDEDALTIIDHYRGLLERANVGDVLALLSPPVVSMIKQCAPDGGLYAKPIVLLVYWLVEKHAFQLGLDWPVPALSSGLDQVRAHLGVS